MSRVGIVSRWPLRLWNFDKHYQYIGGSGGAGVGYGAPAAVGAALANKKHGRLSVNIQNDGDLMYAPGVLWTAAHHQIPLLTRHAQQPRLSSGGHARAAHGQPAQPRHRRARQIGTTIDEPEHRLREARAEHGRVRAKGPITDPERSRPGASSARIDVVKRGEPALVDVVTQPR